MASVVCMSIRCMMPLNPADKAQRAASARAEVTPNWGQCLEAALGTRGLYAGLKLLTQASGFQKPTFCIFCQRFKNRRPVRLSQRHGVCVEPPCACARPGPEERPAYPVEERLGSGQEGCTASQKWVHNPSSGLSLEGQTWQYLLSPGA